MEASTRVTRSSFPVESSSQSASATQDVFGDLFQQLMFQLMDVRRQGEEAVHALTLFDDVGDAKKEQMLHVTSTDDDMQNLNNMMHIMMYAHKKSTAVASQLRTALKQTCGFISALEKRKTILLDVTRTMPSSVVFAPNVQSPENQRAAVEDAVRMIELLQLRLKDMQVALQRCVRDLIRAHLGAFAAFQTSLGDTFHCDMVEDLLS